MKRLNALVLVLTIFAVSILMLTGCVSKPPVQLNTGTEAVENKQTELKTGPFKGMLAPDFVLKDLSGTEWKLSDLKENSVALVFFTSW